MCIRDRYVDAQIERNGGLTINAMSNIDDYNEKHYKGRFRVSSNQLNQKLPFGSIVDYQIVEMCIRDSKNILKCI